MNRPEEAPPVVSDPPNPEVSPATSEPEKVGLSSVTATMEPCPSCAGAVALHAAVCPHCGHRFNGWGVWIVVGTLAAGLLLAAAFAIRWWMQS